LPLYPGLRDTDQDRVIDALAAALRGVTLRPVA
jgi:dTDP-4-amino-4,6-dideoxygalactose transaminase